MSDKEAAHEHALESAQDLYKHLAHNSSLKGLLKPFKGKGDYQELEGIAREAQNKLLVMMKRMVTLTEIHQIAHQRMTLRMHRAESGQNYLRWRTFHNSASSPSGDKLWQKIVGDQLTSPQVKNNLLILERQRIAINMQAACVHSMLRQALQGQNKLALAEDLASSKTTTQPEAHHGDSIQR